mmetsp:Transcript_34258/g.51697  ORF Transcript_34258/g.51697 Transcript_34258/m.51697 type:complete len:87 (+) Transcript_34258:211-471(+)
MTLSPETSIRENFDTVKSTYGWAPGMVRMGIYCEQIDERNGYEGTFTVWDFFLSFQINGSAFVSHKNLWVCATTRHHKYLSYDYPH